MNEIHKVYCVQLKGLNTWVAVCTWCAIVVNRHERELALIGLYARHPEETEFELVEAKPL